MPKDGEDRRLADLSHVSMDRCVAFLLDGIGLESWEEAHLIRCNPCRHEMVQVASKLLEEELAKHPTPEQHDVILINAATIRQAEALIVSCEHCNEDGAEFPFLVILDRVTGSDPTVTDYILEVPAKCPTCCREILEKTFVERA